ncbi:hypothetical protein SDC9_160192 [bioreactor metagenome]|uniref:Uncharacterized protein n=1 Tax=bioreactor metagenome TaxID=1076179 RepID=A0A645FH83_9ZZZZ
MNFRVGRVIELLRQEITGVRSSQLFRFADGTAQAFGTGGQDQLSTIGPQQHATFFAHGLWHHQHTFITAGGSHKRQRNTGIAAGRFNDDAVFVDQTIAFGRIDHGDTNAILH